jgi:cell division septum initiation protein DivIVA
MHSDAHKRLRELDALLRETQVECRRLRKALREHRDLVRRLTESKHHSEEEYEALQDAKRLLAATDAPGGDDE